VPRRLNRTRGCAYLDEEEGSFVDRSAQQRTILAEARAARIERPAVAEAYEPLGSLGKPLRALPLDVGNTGQNYTGRSSNGHLCASYSQSRHVSRGRGAAVLQDSSSRSVGCERASLSTHLADHGGGFERDHSCHECGKHPTHESSRKRLTVFTLSRICTTLPALLRMGRRADQRLHQ
jgi:hypothetical protein